MTLPLVELNDIEWQTVATYCQDPACDYQMDEIEVDYDATLDIIEFNCQKCGLLQQKRHWSVLTLPPLEKDKKMIEVAVHHEECGQDIEVTATLDTFWNKISYVCPKCNEIGAEGNWISE